MLDSTEYTQTLQLSTQGMPGRPLLALTILWHPDPARLAAGVLAGMGFLGAGVIVRQDPMIRGVTTAAVLWMTTIIGLACGSGHYFLGGVATAISLLVRKLHSPSVGGLNRTLKASPPSQNPGATSDRPPCVNVAENFTSIGEPAGGGALKPASKPALWPAFLAMRITRSHGKRVLASASICGVLSVLPSSMMITSYGRPSVFMLASTRLSSVGTFSSSL